MSELPAKASTATGVRKLIEASLPRRYLSERIFRGFGLLSVMFGVLFLGFLLFTIVGNGYGAFFQTRVRLDIFLDPAVIDPTGGRDAEALGTADYQSLIRQSLAEVFPTVTERRERRELSSLVSSGASLALREGVLEDPGLIGQRLTLWLPADDEVDMFIKGRADASGAVEGGRLSEAQVGWIRKLRGDGRLEKKFTLAFLTNGDSREPELAGILGAAKGSLFMILVTLFLSFPLGVAAAIYLEEFAPRNRWVDLLEVNINNLAAVPSIVFGLPGSKTMDPMER